MTELLDYISTWSILKWVILVLVAGFIGQFGRMLAEAVIAKMRRRRELTHQSGNDPSAAVKTVLSDDAERPAPPAVSGETSDKKRIKALAKVRKKEAKNT